MEKNTMGTMPMGKLLFTMSSPIILSMVIQALYNIVDSMFVARYSSTALDAVSLCYPIQMIIIAISVGSALGVQALLGRFLGSKNYKMANLIASHGILIAICNSIIFALVGIFLSSTFINMFTNDSVIANQGIIYMQICTIFSFGVFVEITYERFMQATGNAIYNMIIQGLGAIINIILDPILIFGLFGLPAMGVKGAAIATVVGQIIGMLIGIVITHYKVKDIHIMLRFKVDKELLKNIYNIAIPAMLMNSIMSIMTVFMNMILVEYSTLAVSVYSVYFKLQQFLFMAILGLNNAVIAIISFNYGARKKERIKSCIKYSLLVTIVIMFVGMIVFQLFPKELLMLFDASEDMFIIGIKALKVISLSFVFAGISVQISGILQALDGSKQSLFITLLRQLVIIIPFAYVLSKTLGLNYVWYAFPITEFGVCILSIIFMLKTNRNIINNI